MNVRKFSKILLKNNIFIFRYFSPKIRNYDFRRNLILIMNLIVIYIVL